MKHENVGDNISALNASWSFSGDTAEQFDAHIKSSVPHYDDGHDLVCKLSDFFVKEDSTVYDIGASTGTLLEKLCKRHENKSNIQWVGIDTQQDMVDQAQKKVKANITIQEGDAVVYDFNKSDMITAYYTIQFIPPKFRQNVIDKIYESLNWGGAFIWFEKVRANDARFQDITTAMYTDYKLDQGYNPEEIVAKSRSLKGVLEPFSTEGNMGLLNRAGFVDILPIFKYICFEGYVAIK